MIKFLTEYSEDHYRIDCDCLDDDHALRIIFEPIDDFLPEYSMILETTCDAFNPYDPNKSWYKRLWNEIKWRISTAFKVLFKGYIEVRREFILSPRNYDALKYVVNKLENRIKTES